MMMGTVPLLNPRVLFPGGAELCQMEDGSYLSSLALGEDEGPGAALATGPLLGPLPLISAHSGASEAGSRPTSPWAASIPGSIQ